MLVDTANEKHCAIETANLDEPISAGPGDGALSQGDAFHLIELGADTDGFLSSKWGDHFEDHVAEQDEIGYEIEDLADYMFRQYGGLDR